MSLDVSLSGEYRTEKCTCNYCGHEHEKQVADDLFEANITNNLWSMAQAAGIYEHVWRPQEIGIFKAKDLIEPLRNGIQKMKYSPDTYKQFNASNGWGTYDQFIPWLERYLTACIENPDAEIRASS